MDLHTYTDLYIGAQILMAGPLLLTRPYSGYFLLLCLEGPGHEPDSDLDLSPLPSTPREISITLGCSCQQRGGHLGPAQKWSQQGHAR